MNITQSQIIYLTPNNVLFWSKMTTCAKILPLVLLLALGKMERQMKTPLNKRTVTFYHQVFVQHSTPFFFGGG